MIRGLRVDSWTKLNTGDHVYDVAEGLDDGEEPRHVGRLEGIVNYIGRVTWLESGWTSHIPINELVRVERKVYDSRLRATITIRRRSRAND